MKSFKPSRYPRRKPTTQALMKIYQALFKHFGCRHWWPAQTPFEVMVGAILTQGTAWSNVEKAIHNLKKEKVLTPLAIKKVSHAKLARLIRPAGYFNSKAKRLRNFIDFLWKNFDGNLKKMFKVPLEPLREKLLEVNGIGPETADSILLYAAGKTTFVVDAYTRRVFTRHRYLRGDEDYETIRTMFMRLLRKDRRLYNDYHAQIVQVGKDYCKKVPLCENCPLNLYL